MPQAVWTIASQNIQVQKAFAVPKKVTYLYKGWYKDARKHIPDLPLVPELDNCYDPVWKLSGAPYVSTEYIGWEFVNNVGEKAKLVIARKVSHMGR
jgi:hypothetical protein